MPQREPSTDLDVLLEHLKRSRGFDFTGYKRSTLERRIAKRMEAVGADGYLEYVDHLEVDPDEFVALFNTILINVTGFFRDTTSWDYLRAEVIPVLAERASDRPVRVWCAGCASGEETYSVAMLLAETMGEQRFLERVKIYATDVDEEALAEARAAVYTADQATGVPEDMRERFFEQVDDRYVFRKDLRRAVIFGRNDLVQDAPISRIDLLTCRNTLMYFNAETQAKILSRFNFALNDDGYLFLGKSEMLITHAELFRPLNLKRRVFTKIPRPTIRERLLFASSPYDDVEAGFGSGSVLQNAALDHLPIAELVIDADGFLVQANRKARALFRLAPTDVGRPVRDLEISYRPVELRVELDRAMQENRTLPIEGVAYQSADGTEYVFDAQIVPLQIEGEMLGTIVTFDDVTAQRRLADELEKSRNELENTYEELQSTVEELETTNEELQSTNEELETTNEELQSTNEELETMNEELQSTNEELETINDELRQRTDELNDVNAFLETILRSMGVAVVVVDRRSNVQVWNHHATDMWGLRPDEVDGHHLLGLDIGLPVGELKAALKQVLDGDGDGRVERELAATNRRGRQIVCRVTLLPLVPGRADGEVSGAILLMDQVT